MARMKSQLLGSRELAAVFRELPDRLANNALSSVARAGAKELRLAALAQLALAMHDRTPRDDDMLMKHVNDPGARHRATYKVGPPARKFYLRMLHDGTQAHIISAADYVRTSSSGGHRPGRRRRREPGTFLADVRRGLFFGKEVVIPQQPPRPYLAIAVHVSQEAVQRKMAAALRKALPRQVRKLVSEKYRGQSISRIMSNTARIARNLKGI